MEALYAATGFFCVVFGLVALNAAEVIGGVACLLIALTLCLFRDRRRNRNASADLEHWQTTRRLPL